MSAFLVNSRLRRLRPRCHPAAVEVRRPPGMLTARCGTDAALSGEVEALLAYEADDDFLRPGAARAELIDERRVLKIVASRNGEVVWTDRVPHDANTPLGRTGVIPIPPFDRVVD